MLDGYFADTGGTIVVPPISGIKARLCHAAQMALKNAIAEATIDAPINRLGKLSNALPKLTNLR